MLASGIALTKLFTLPQVCHHRTVHLSLMIPDLELVEILGLWRLMSKDFSDQFKSFISDRLKRFTLSL
jgi:hypothetical protein